MSEQNLENQKDENQNEEGFKEYATFTITTSAGEEVEMAVVDEFEYEHKNYVAAARIIDDGIDEEGLFIYRVKVGEDDFKVEKITNKFDYDKVVNAYMEME